MRNTLASIAFSLLSAVSFSAGLESAGLYVTVPQISTELTSIRSNNLVYRESFEDSLIFKGLHRQFPAEHSFAVVTHPVLEGRKSGRFELRSIDPMQSGGKRAEVLFPEQSNLHRWYGFSVYFPSDDYTYDSSTEIITQWHQSRGASPSIALEIKADRYYIVIPPKVSETGKHERIDLGPVTKDVWNRFTFRIIHSDDQNGLLEVWLNGLKVLNRSGSNMYSLDTASSPRWKLGVYKWKWNGDQKTDTSRRVLYLDDIRIGNHEATLVDMTSEVGHTPDGSTEL